MLTEARMRLFHLLHLFYKYLYFLLYSIASAYQRMRMVCDSHAKRIRLHTFCANGIRKGTESLQGIKKETDKRVAHRRSLPDQMTAIIFSDGAMRMYHTCTWRYSRFLLL